MCLQCLHHSRYMRSKERKERQRKGLPPVAAVTTNPGNALPFQFQGLEGLETANPCPALPGPRPFAAQQVASEPVGLLPRVRVLGF